MREKSKETIRQAILILVIMFLLFIMLYPLAMALWNSFKSQAQYEVSRWYPTLPLKIKNLSQSFSLVSKYIYNTIFVAVVGILGSLFVSSLASFAFAKTDFPGKKFFFYIVIILMMVPGVMTLIPQSILYNSLKLNDNLFALIIPMWTGGCIGSVFLLNMCFNGLPKEIFDAAKVDGANMFMCYTKIALPLSSAILCTIAIMNVISVWNDYLWPTIMLSPDKYTISAGLLLQFSTEFSADMPIMFSTYLVSSLPIVILFIFANKFYIQGLLGASIKM
ncbi:MAG: carbohydrate ABC transporter permease [Christensenellales bacterium]